MLQAFYDKGSRAKVSLLDASPVKEDADANGISIEYQGAYQGEQASSVGIIGMLSTIEYMFDRDIKLMTKTEKKAAADAVEFQKTQKSDLRSNEKQKELD